MISESYEIVISIQPQTKMSINIPVGNWYVSDCKKIFLMIVAGLSQHPDNNFTVT